MNNLFDVENKIVLITGSSRGLGFSLAKGFTRAGAKVLVNGTQEGGVKKAVLELSGQGGPVKGYAFDISNKEMVEAKIGEIEMDVGPIEVLINNAGIHKRAPLEELSIEDWNRVLEINLTSAFVVSQTVARRMISRRKGQIINITSLNAEMARPSIGNYCAVKGGLKMLTKSMAAEWGKYNIRTNAIGPGYFSTDLTAVLQKDPQFDAWVKQEVPLARWGQPHELVGAAIFLASEASSYINGHTIYIDGGWQAAL